MTVIQEPATGTATISKKPSSSIRTRILLLTTLPALAISGIWLFITFGLQAKNDQRLLLNNVVQTAKTFSERVIDLEENMLLGIEDEELQSNIQVRAEEVVRSSALPITDIAVVDSEGNLSVGFNKSFPEGLIAQKPQKDILTQWRNHDPEVSKAAIELANKTLEQIYLTQSGEATDNQNAIKGTQTTQIKNGALILAANSLPGADGVVITAIDGQFLKNRIQQNVIRSLTILGSVLLLSIIIASLIANGLIRRIQRLSTAAEKVSNGELKNVIPISGNDEITNLGESIDLLRDSMVITLSHIEGD